MLQSMSDPATMRAMMQMNASMQQLQVSNMNIDISTNTHKVNFALTETPQVQSNPVHHAYEGQPIVPPLHKP